MTITPSPFISSSVRQLFESLPRTGGHSWLLDGSCDPLAVIRTRYARFTVLSPRTVRVEHSRSGHFCDQPTFFARDRRHGVPAYTVTGLEGGGVRIATDELCVRYRGESRMSRFDGGLLSIEVLQTGEVWTPGLQDPSPLLAPLMDPVVSGSGWSVIDDAGTPALADDEDGVASRFAAAAEGDEPVDEGALDFYFIGHGGDAMVSLAEVFRISGKPPLVTGSLLGPMWACGGPECTQEGVARLAARLQRSGLPVTAMLIGREWSSAGRFPAPEAFTAQLRGMGLGVGLAWSPEVEDNRWPQPDVWWVPHDTAAASSEELLHHTAQHLEAKRLFQRQRQSQHRLVIGPDIGLGCHRYLLTRTNVVTEASWRGLRALPRRIAAAANSGCLWYHSEAGGHAGLDGDGELLVRWTQLAALSPLMRVDFAVEDTLPCYETRFPWDYDETTQAMLRAAFQARVALMPYLGTMAYETHANCVPLCRPLHYRYGHQDGWPAYPDQYLFGLDLLAVPVTSQLDPDTRLARVPFALPPGGLWYSFESGEAWPGGTEHVLHAPLSLIPLFAREGAIVPVLADPSLDPAARPSALELRFYSGSDGQFELYETHGAYAALTRISATYTEGEAVLVVSPVEAPRGARVITRGGTSGGGGGGGEEEHEQEHEESGDNDGNPEMIGPGELADEEADEDEIAFDPSVFPLDRELVIKLYGVAAPDAVHCSVDGAPVAVEAAYRPESELITISGLRARPRSEVIVRVTRSSPILWRRNRVKDKCRAMLRAFKAHPKIKREVDLRLDEVLADVKFLADGSSWGLTASQAAALTDAIRTAYLLPVRPESDRWPPSPNNRFQSSSPFILK